MNTTANLYREMTAPDGRLLIVRVDEHHDHTAVTVVSHMNTSLDRAMPHQEADAYLAFLEQEWATGIQMWLLEEQAGILTTVSAALDRFETAMVAELNTVLDATDARLEAGAEAQREKAGVADIMADTKQAGGWTGARTAAKNNTLGRQIRPTKTNVHVKPPTPAQLDRMRRHHNGRVTAGDGQSWLLLDGIVQRGLADRNTVEYWPGTNKIRAVRLNQRGWTAIGQHEQVAA
jgi:hypothetical protein